jgi:DNA mismatch repair protein MutS2
MMIKDTPRLLEFEKIIDRISLFAHSPATTPLISALSPLSSKIDIELRLSLVEEIRNLFNSGIKLPIEPFEDIVRVIELARPEGSLLSTDELSLLIPVLKVSDRIKKFLLYRSDVPLLIRVSGDVSSFPDILEPLEQSIAPDGGLLDSASNLLFNLRRNQRHLVARIRKRLEEIVRERETAIFLQDDFVTQRNGRWVIPVRMDSKGMVPGVVHDVSRSGETAFMEPIEIISIVNELENLNAEEKAEQIRILKEITAWIREDADAILSSFRALVNLDFLNSIASFADLIDARKPQISDEMTIEIHGGYHPLLLMMANETSVKSVVPLDLSLGGETGVRTLLITGPNTGGKTIAIKVAGVLTLMAQSGIPVPAGCKSVFPARAKIAADIGDEQSIEESLSTFSSHIRKISAILDKADERTIILLDELGTGTDPLQGGAIACATLAELMKKGSVVLATTHLIDIVTYVQKTPGMMNAAMEFDRKSLTPLYRLTIGEPGQSHALDIARRCGLPERIIEAATLFAGKMESEFHSLLSDLKAGRRANELLNSELLFRENEISAKELQLEIAQKELDRLRREAREKGILEAKAIVNSAKAELNHILEEARKEKCLKTARTIASLEKELETELNEISPKPMIDAKTLRAGSTVYLKTLGSNATVLTVDGKHERLRLRAGNLEVEVPFSAISAAESEPHARKTAFPGKSRKQHHPETAYELNLVGWRVEEALTELDKFLDSSALNGLAEVRIIHGKGTGALMRGVREDLSRNPHVENFRSGESFEGGEGVTVVKLFG